MRLSWGSSQPLLPHNHQTRQTHQASSNDTPPTYESPHDHHHLLNNITTLRLRLRAFLSSKYQHITILTLVTLDILSIFADLFLALFMCENPNPPPPPPHGEPSRLAHGRAALGAVSLGLSCVFMAELALSLFAFGRRFADSAFRVFDGGVIVAGFAVDVALRGAAADVASLVVLLRLWRFFQIFEEFGVASQERVEGLELRIAVLERENAGLKLGLGKSRACQEEEEEEEEEDEEAAVRDARLGSSGS